MEKRYFGRIRMYTLDYLNCFIENLDLPEASRASLRENCETLVTTPGVIDELVSAETLLFKDYGIDGAYGVEWKPIVPHMDALSERTGLHRHVVDFLFLALASERLRENYRAAGHHRRPKIQAYRVPRRIRHLGHIRCKLVSVVLHDASL